MKAKALSIVTIIALLLSLIPAAVLPLAAGAEALPSTGPTGAGGGPSTQEVITWVKYTGNPVLNPGAAGAWDAAGIYSPSVLLVSGTYHMWYTGAATTAGNQGQIGHATSANGIAWTKDMANPVLSHGAAGDWDSSLVVSPTVLLVGATYHMWYAGFGPGSNQIGHATSLDGTLWTKDVANPVLTKGAAGSWDDGYVTGASVLQVGATYHMWYTGVNGAAAAQIGHATSASPDGAGWAKDAANPVLILGAAGTWDELGLFETTVLLDGGTYHMRYTGSNGTAQIGHATSAVPDGAGWARDAANPVLVPGPAAWDAANLFDADVILGSQKMWYTGANAGGVNQIGYAVLATKGITIAPNSGPVGTNVLVHGFGFTPGEYATVTFGSPALVVSGVPVGADGKFNVAFNVPDSTKGSHAVDAYTPSDPAADTPDQLFIVMPSLTLTPFNWGRFGDVITATWKGFLANEAGLKVMFDGVDQPTTPAAPVANASGTGSATWTIPAAVRGPHVVDGRGATTTAAEVPNVPFLVKSMLLAPNPAAGAVGTLVNIGVRGFLANEPGIFITMNPGPVVVIGPVGANAAGSYDGAFNVPPKVKGVHVLDAYSGTYNAVDIVDRSFTVNSSLALAPSAGPIGTLVNAAINGFAPNSPITMTFAGGNPGNVNVTVLSVDTDADGSVAGSFTVPDATTGGHTVFAIDGAGNAASAAFLVVAGVFINPNAGPVGTVVDITGGGFAPNEDNIAVAEDGVNRPLTNQSIAGTTAGTAKADAFGAWTAKFTVASVAGPHTIDASGAITPAGSVQDAIFNVQPNLILTPTSGYGGTTLVTAEGHGYAANSAVTFTFGGVAQATNAAVTTNATGDFAGATFTAPIRSAVVHQVVATDASGNSGAAPFTILGGPVQNLRTGTYYGTIGAAIGAATTLPGDTLVAFPGLYQEFVNLYKANLILKSYAGAPIILGGEALTTADTTIDGSGIAGGQAVMISATGVTVKGFTIRDTDAGSLAVRVAASTATVDDCVLRDSPGGGLVRSDGVNNLTVRNSTLTANAGGGGLWLNSGSGDLIQNNSIHHNPGRGLRITAGNTGAIVELNTINNNTQEGIRTDGTNANIHDNAILNNGLSGVFLENNAAGNTIQQNVLSGNANWGIRAIAGSWNNMARWNNITGNLSGGLSKDGDTIRLNVTTALNGAAAVNDTVTVNYIKGDGTAGSVNVTITDAQALAVVAIVLPAGTKAEDVTDVSLAKGAGATSTVGVFNIEGSSAPNRVMYTYNLAGPVKTDGASLIQDALFNWWGHASGPTHASNVGGTGQLISGTGLVLYSSWLGAPWAAAGPLEGPSVASPTTFYVNNSNPGSIQTTIDAASPGDTIVAMAGTYNEKANVNKTLTLRSFAGAATTILNGAGLPGSVITVTADDVVIGGSGFTIQNAAENAILFQASGPAVLHGGLVQDNILQNNSLGAGVAIQEGASGITVGPGNQIINNKYGLWIAGDNNLITQNLIKWSSANGGVRLEATADGNHINWNRFWGNNMGVSRANSPAAAVDARYNYWHHPLGPTHVSNPGGVGDPITDNVDYSPWLGLVPGTVPMTFYVNTTGTIQEALDTAQPGDTVLVRPGTYNESLVIAPPLTVQSTNGALVTIIDAQGAPVGVYIHDPGVIFQGFTVKNCETGIVAELSDGVQILNNIVIIDGLVLPLAEAGKQNGLPTPVQLGEGIVIGGSANALVRGNTVQVTTVNSGMGIIITTALPLVAGKPAAQNGAPLPSPNAQVLHNNVSVNSPNEAYGIVVDNAPGSVITDNILNITSVGTPEHPWPDAIGILVQSSPNTRVGGTGNNINASANGEDAYAYGILLGSSPESSILQNHLTVGVLTQTNWYSGALAVGVYVWDSPKVLIDGNTDAVRGQADILVPLSTTARPAPEPSQYAQGLKDMKAQRAAKAAEGKGKGPRGQQGAWVEIYGAAVEGSPQAKVTNNNIDAGAQVGTAPAPAGAQQWADAYVEGLLIYDAPLSEVGGNNIGASAGVAPGAEEFIWPYTWAEGMWIGYSEKINIHDNHIVVSSVYDAMGMFIYDSPRSDVMNNTLQVTVGPNDWSAYADGVYIYYSDYLVFKGNTVDVNGSVSGPWPESYVYLYGIYAHYNNYLQILSNTIAVNALASEPFGYSWAEGIHQGHGQWAEIAANTVNANATTELVPWDQSQNPMSAARPRPARSDDAKEAMAALAKSKGLKKQDGYQYGEAFSRAIHVVSAPHAEVVRNTAHATSQIGPAGPGTLGTDDYQYGEGYADAYGIELDYSHNAIVQSNNVNANADNHLVVEAEGSLAPTPQQGAQAWGWGWSEAVGIALFSSQNGQVNQNSVAAQGNMTLDIMAIGYGGAFDMSQGALLKLLSRFKESMKKSQEAALERSGQKASEPAAQWAYAGFEAVSFGIGIWAMDAYGIQIVGNSPVQGSGLLTGNAYAGDLIFDHEAGAYGWGLALGEGIEVDWSDNALIKGNTVQSPPREGQLGPGALGQTSLVIVAEELPAAPAAQWAEALGMGEAYAYGILVYESYSPDVVSNTVQANADSNVGVLASEGFRWEEAWASSYAGAMALGIAVDSSPGNLIKGNNASASASAHQDDRAEGVGVDPWAQAYAESWAMGIYVWSYGRYGSQQQGQNGNPYFDTRIIENTAGANSNASGVATAVESVTLPLHAGAYTSGYSFGAGIYVESRGYYGEGSAQQYYYGALIQGNQAQAHANTAVDAHSTDTTAVPEAYAYGYGGSHADGIALMGAGNSLMTGNTVSPVSANTTVNVSASGEITQVGKWGYAYADGIDLYFLWNVQVVGNNVSSVGSWLNVDPNGQVVYNGPGYSTDIYGFYLENPLIKGNTLDFLVYGNPGHGIDLFLTWGSQVLKNNLWPGGYVAGQKGAAIRGAYSWGMRIGGNNINGWGVAPSTGIALVGSWAEVFRNNIHGTGIGLLVLAESDYQPGAELLAQLKAKGIEPPAASDNPMVNAHMNNIAGNSEFGVLAKSPPASPSPTSEAGAQVGVIGPILVNAALNWWGHISGPSGEGTGSGDAVSKHVEYRPWDTINFETQLAEDGGYFGMERWFKLQGWNTLSTPIRLRSDANNLGSIVKTADYDLAYRFNNALQTWELIDSSFILNPLEAIFTHSVRETRARFLFKHDPSAAPERDLVPGWALVSVAPPWDANPPFFPGGWRRPVEDALRSIDGKYSRVLNPRLDMERGWIGYMVGGTPSWAPPGPPLATFEGYWVEIKAGAQNVIYKGSSLTPVRMP